MDLIIYYAMQNGIFTEIKSFIIDNSFTAFDHAYNFKANFFEKSKRKKLKLTPVPNA